MAYDTDQAQLDFENIELEEFGVPITYIPHGGSEKPILGIIERGVDGGKRPGIDQVRLGRQFNPGMEEISILISQGNEKGVASITKGLDVVKMRREPDDEFEKYLKVKSAKPEYGCWRLGVA